MSAGNKDTYISIFTLPKVNGIYINSIYHMYDSFSEERRVTSYRDSTDYYELVPYFSKDKRIRVKTLPPLFSLFFGKQVINRNVINVSSCSFRTSNSGHANHDDTISLRGLDSRGCDDYFGLYRGFEYFSPDYMIEKTSELAQKLIACIGADITVEELPDWYCINYPATFLRNEDGLNYPDEELDTWRKLGRHPYVTYNNKKDIRVYHSGMKAHLYLQRVDEWQEGDEDLVSVSFVSSHDTYNEYCNIATWGSRSSTEPNGIIRYRIGGLKNKKDPSSRLCSSIFNDKIISTGNMGSNPFYRIAKIIYS